MEMPEDLQNDHRAGWKYAHPEPGDEIVISGLSGIYPESDNVAIFSENLFNKKDMITGGNRGWALDIPEIPKYSGKIHNLNRFDTGFFGIYYKQVNSMDPMNRKLLEKTYEAVIDAGLNPEELKGSRTGVFMGTCTSETETSWFYDKGEGCELSLTGYVFRGLVQDRIDFLVFSCLRGTYVQRISYWLGLRGPSQIVDTACSSSMSAVDLAYKSIRDGGCDMAIVCGSNLCIHPLVSLQFAR